METFGNLIDKLTICNLRIWMAEDIKRDINANDQQISHATRITNTCNQMRNDLIQEIDETIIADETYWAPEWHLKGALYPFWATRNPSSIIL